MRRCAPRRLETEGLVRIEPRKGTVVTYGPKQAEEMSLTRAAVESVITRQAALHGTEARFDQLRAPIEQMRDADRAERLMREHIVNAGKQHISLVFNTSD